MLEVLIGESSEKGADLRAQVVHIEEAVYVERVRIDRFERDVVAKAGERQSLLAERQQAGKQGADS